jgi:hypothetical protein
MKLNKLLFLGATSLIISSVPALANAGQVPTSQNATITQILLANAQPVTQASGKFISAEKTTTGTARIVTEN